MFGTVKPLGSFDPVWAQVAYWAELWRKAGSLPRRRDRLRLWIAPPDWPPGPDHGPVAGPRPRFDPPLSSGTKAYVVGWFVPVVVVTFLMLLHANRGDRTLLAAGFGFVAATLVALGGLLDDRPWARPLEAARVATLALVLAAWA